MRNWCPNKRQKGPPRKRRPQCEFANRKFQMREFKYLLLVRCRSRGGSTRLHLLRVILDKGLQVAVAEASVEVVVLHFRISLIVGPVVHVEAIDGAHDSGAVTAASAVREELAGRGIVDEFQKSINRLLLRVAGIAHRNINVAHPEGFYITLLIVGRTV